MIVGVTFNEAHCEQKGVKMHNMYRYIGKEMLLPSEVQDLITLYMENSDHKI